MPEILDTVIVELIGDDSKLKQALDRAERSATKAAGKIERAFDRAVGPSTRLLGSVTVLGGALSALGIKAVGMAGQMEQARIGLTTMLGSAQAADKHLRKLYDFAAKTPFEINGLIDADRRLMAMGFSAGEVIPTLTAIGDAVAAVGGSAELLDRVTLALGQMRAKGKVSGEEMRQLAEAGIPAWEMLAQKIGTDIPTAMKMAEQGGIDAATGIGAILEGMEDRFAGSMEAQSRTILGMWSNVKDILTRSMISLGNTIVDALNVRAALQAALDALGRFRNWLETGGLQKWWKDYKNVVIVVAGAITGALVPAVVALTGALWGALAPLTPFLTAGAALAGAFIALGGTMDDVKTMVKTLGVLFHGLWDVFAGLGRGMLSTISALDEAWQRYISGLGRSVALLGDAVQATLAGDFGRATELVNTAALAAKTAWGGAIREIATANSEAMDRINTGLGELAQVVTGQVGASYDAARDKAKAAADEAANGFGVRVPAAAKQTGQAIANNVVAPLKQAVEQAKSLGDYLTAASGTLYGRQPGAGSLGQRGAAVAPVGGNRGIAGGSPELPGLLDFDQAAREAAKAAEDFTRSLHTISGTGSSVYGTYHDQQPGLGHRGRLSEPYWGPGMTGGEALPYQLRMFGAEGSDAKYGRQPVYDAYTAGERQRRQGYSEIAAWDSRTASERDRRRGLQEIQGMKTPEWLLKLQGAFGNLSQSLGGVIGQLNPFAAILQAINPIGEVFKGMLESLKPVLEPIIKVFHDIGGLLGRIIAPVLKAVTPILQALEPAFRALGTVVAWLWNAIATVVNALFGWAGAHLEKIDLNAPASEGTTAKTAADTWTGWGGTGKNVATIGIATAPAPVAATPGWVHTFGSHVDRFGQYVARLVEEGIRVQVIGTAATAGTNGVWDRAIAGDIG